MKNLASKILKPKVLLAAFMAFAVAGCSDYLDREPLSDYLSSDFYKSDAAVQQGAAGCYNMLYQDLHKNGAMFPTMMLWDMYTPFGIERSDNASIGVGNIDLRTNYSVEQMWAQLYTAVARCNNVLYGAEPFKSELTSRGLQHLAEIKVLRAYYYMHLVSLWGDVPFLTEPTKPQDDLSKIARTPWKEIVSYLLEDLDKAAADLPWTYSDTKDWGRIDKSVAFGIRARLALYAGSWCKFGFGMNAEKDLNKATEYFTIAASSAKSIINESGRKLCPSYPDLFTSVGQQTAAAKAENMLQIMFTSNGSKKVHWLSVGEQSRIVGQSGRFPTQMLVDQFETKNGLRIDKDPSYKANDPFTNRDPRLKYTIYTNGETIIANSGGKKWKFVMDVYNPKVKSYDEAGNMTLMDNKDYEGPVSQYGYIKSGVGYLWKKYNHFDDEDNWTATYNIVLMRYAEILLTYAEAKIELNQIDATVYDAIDQVRGRVGMPGILIVDPTRAGDQAKMRQIVRRERKVELAKEALYLFDMRRWRLGSMQNAEPTYGYPFATGVDASKNIYPNGYSQATADMIPSFTSFGTESDLNDIPSYAAYADKLRMRDKDRSKSWNDRYYLWPIPQTERNKAPWLTQNDGYAQ